MAEVTFEQEPNSSQYQSFEAAESTLVQLALKTGIPKDKSQANMLLMGVALLFSTITVWLLVATLSSPKKLPPPVMPQDFQPSSNENGF